MVTRLWSAKGFEDVYERVVIRGKRGDVALRDIFTDKTWLAHFAIEDLYIGGEFDNAIG